MRIDIPGSSGVMHRIPYELIRSKSHGVTPESNFIVYLLVGKRCTGERSLYVGISTKGIDVRPRSHEDKPSIWEQCIIFSAASKDLCKSTILYIEDRLKTMIDETVEFENDTLNSESDGANEEQEELADTKFIPAIRQVYDILGIKLRDTIQEKLVIDEPVAKPFECEKTSTDFSFLKISAKLNDLYAGAELMARELDRTAETNIPKSKGYVSLKHNGLTAAYCYPLRKEDAIRVYLRGTKEWYSDSKVTARSEKAHNGDCKAEFYIRDEKDLGYFRMFLKTAMDGIDNKRKL